MNGEGAQSLEGLAELAKAADAPADDAGAPGAPPAAAPPQLDEAQAWAQVPAMAGAIFSEAWPELKDVYSDAACQRWGAAMVEVAKKYGWKPDQFFAWLGPWAGVAIATFPMARATFKAARARLQAAQAADSKPDQGQSAAPQA